MEAAEKKAKEVEKTRKRKATDSAKQARRAGKVRRLGDEQPRPASLELPDPFCWEVFLTGHCL